MPQLRVTITGERIRSFFTLKLREIDRQIDRGQRALQTIKDDLEQVAKVTQEHLSQVQARMMRQPQGLSQLGIGVGDYMPAGNVHGTRNQIGRVENLLAELTYKRQQVQWLSEQFEPSKSYEIDGPDMTLFGMVPFLSNGAFATGMYAAGGDPFDLLC